MLRTASSCLARPLKRGSAGAALQPLWRARALHVHAHTLSSPTPSSLKAHLSALPLTWASSEGLLFSFSTSLPAASITPLLDILAAHPNAVGSFHLSPTQTPEVSVSTFTPEKGEAAVKSWHLSETGRAPPSVGKWRRPGEQEYVEDDAGDSIGSLEDRLKDGGWDGLWKAQGESARIDVGDAKNVGTLVALTDATPAPTLEALDAFPAAAKLGYVAAPTPFLTGYPFTLFHGRKVLQTGAVGLALPKPADVAVEYGVESFAAPTRVKAARGNLLLTIEGPNPNPTATLIAALHVRDKGKAAGLTKDESFWLQIKDPKTSELRVVHILSGDPSRGALSLDTEIPLVPGQEVQFMCRTGALPLPEPLGGALRFVALARTDDVAVAAKEGAPQTIDGFLVSSEGGFICSPAGVPTAVITVSGAAGTAGWR
ncbi:hypothetical protein Q8F55_006780 [Vanrija albida]|uniref:FIST domain-containing protein n=1 Tax=Vanrija albida TaxID=181172 RepID=A0ABR3PZ12_9TREE